MARRPSTVSVASLASSRTPPESSKSPGSASVLLPPLSRVISQPSSAKSQDDVADISPDDLFAKYTIPEVKAKQAQLRADAEAKQEDLRIMVGERYRDLLQASSSIISIATSAKRVQEALDETNTAIRSQSSRLPSVESHASQSGRGDSHLQTLQVLSAHIKLLLDTPEHLWRLIEREKYFQAAWLFLLARVVHRALIRDDAQDDESWTQHGIDVLEQFPLIQRQWETVSHFRSQIIHKATLSLRLYDKTAEETCATLLTLHILDSRPLAEALAVYLSQRTRTLNVLLAKSLDVPEQHDNGLLMNGEPPESRKISERTAVVSAHTIAPAIRNSTRTALEVISRTLQTARAVFGTPASTCSLALSVLKSIQSATPSSPSPNVPAELDLSTQAVLNALPSSTYVSLLPANIRAYRPFVDLSSVSSSLPQETLRGKLVSWFDQSKASLRGTFDKWLMSLDVVSAVWKVRLSLRKWVVHSGLEAAEIFQLTELLDEVIGMRITGIWKSALVRAEEEFLKSLRSVGHDNEDMFSTLCNLYCPLPAIHPPTGAGSSPFDPSFHAYKATLTRRLEGRVLPLHESLGTLESAAASLQDDLVKMFVDGEGSKKLIIDLTGAYRPEARALCIRVVSALKTSSEELMDSCDDITLSMSRLVFHAHIAKELSTSSFVCDIRCDQAVATSFREELDALFERIMSYWHTSVVSKLVAYYAQNAIRMHKYPGFTEAHPSPPMMETLYLLSSSIHNLGMSHHQPYLMTISRKMITKFSAAFVQIINDGTPLSTHQVLHDLSFLRHLASKWKDADMTALEDAINRLRSQLADSSKFNPDLSASEYFARTQMLISALVPSVTETTEPTPKENGDKTAGALTYGVPVVDSQFVSAVELAPPSSRFPLLLIDAR